MDFRHLEISQVMGTHFNLVKSYVAFVLTICMTYMSRRSSQIVVQSEAGFSSDRLTFHSSSLLSVASF